MNTPSSASSSPAASLLFPNSHAASTRKQQAADQHHGNNHLSTDMMMLNTPFSSLPSGTTAAGGSSATPSLLSPVVLNTSSSRLGHHQSSLLFTPGDTLSGRKPQLIPTSALSQTTPSLSSSSFADHFAAPPAAHAQPPPSSSSSSSLSPALLRSLVHRALTEMRYESAIFFADKLCSLSSTILQYHPAASPATPLTSFPSLSDLHLLADCYYRHGEHRRAIHALRTRTTICPAHAVAQSETGIEDVWRWIMEGDEPHSLSLSTPNDATLDTQTRALLVFRCWYLLSCCLTQCQEYEEALLIMGNDDEHAKAIIERFLNTITSNTKNNSNPITTSSSSSSSSLIASYCYHRGTIYELQQHRNKAVLWFTIALKLDVSCVEAFDRLIDRRMLSFAEERLLMHTLVFPEELHWLELIYWNKIQQYDPKQQQPQQQQPAAEEQKQTDSTFTTSTSLLQHLSLLTTQYHIVDNVELYVALVHHLYQRTDYAAAFTLSSRLLEQDPYSPHLLPLHLLLLVSLQKKADLFSLAHQLVQSSATSVLSWYAVGCYYYVIGKYELCRKYLSKCHTLQMLFLPAWLMFGHAFAAQEEGDQAMIAYRTAARLFEGSHLPLLCIGMEYLRNNNEVLAQAFFTKSLAIFPNDPLALNEMGVIAYKKKDFATAVDLFQRSLSLVSASASASASTTTTSAQLLSSSWETTHYNLGHAFRKMFKYEQAIQAYYRAMSSADTSLHTEEQQNTVTQNREASWQDTADAATMQDVQQSSVQSVLPSLSSSASPSVSLSALSSVSASALSSSAFHRSLLTALGFVYHLMGDVDKAIQMYHQSLAAQPRDTLTQELLTRALKEELTKTDAFT